MNKENNKYSAQYPKITKSNQSLTTRNLLKFKNKSHNEIFNLIFLDDTDHIGTHLNTVIKQIDKLYHLKKKLSQRNSMTEVRI